jgi:hypothetical protein
VSGSGPDEMSRKFLIFLISLVFVILIAQIPVFPSLVEVRSFSADGESLSQTLQFVSVSELYDSAMFARVAWLDSTFYFYIALFVFNHGVLLVLFWVCVNVLKRMFAKLTTDRNDMGAK